MNAEAFVPRLLQRYDREKPWQEWLPGSVLFADISGFTPMAEALSVLGAEGSEILTNILNRYFTDVIGIIHSAGGEVMKFGGDSILCYFASNDATRAIHAATSISLLMQKFEKVKTPVQTFTLRIRIGIASGEMLFAGLGDPGVRCDYVFCGRPIDLAAKAQQHAKPGETVIASDSSKELDGDKVSRIAPGFYKIVEHLEAPHFQSIALPSFESQSTESLQPYLIPELYEMVSNRYQRYVGSLQMVVPVFMEFTGFSYTKETFDLNRMHDFSSAVLQTIATYNGRLNAITMDDKGSNFFLHFGAPNPIESKEEQALEWALAVRALVEERFSNITVKLGLTVGKAFCGIVGGSGRFSYTVVGDAINLAARLMQIAPDKQILVSKELKEKVQNVFSFRHSGRRTIKGRRKLTSVYSLNERAAAGPLLSQRQLLIGRRQEIEQLLAYLRKSKEGLPSMVVLEGEPGIGKTALATHISALAKNEGWLILTGKSEITRRHHPYRPWLQVFGSIFFQGKKPELHDIAKLFDSGTQEMQIFLPWLADFFQIRHSQSVTGYDEKAKKIILHHKLILLFLKYIKQRSVFLFLDDLHWFDSLSLELLSDLLNHLKDEPLFVLAASRSNWRKEEFVRRPNTHYIKLSEMDRATTAEMIEKFLKGGVKEALVDFVYSHTYGNQFFTVQLLHYLKSKNLLVHLLGEWSIQRDAKLEESSTEDIILAQLENFNLPQIIHLRTAGCMGPTFSVAVLERAVGKRFRKKSFYSLCDAGYFELLDDNWVTFSHALIQETIYRSIPQRLRKANHRRIACSMEKLFVNEKDKYASNLANHFYLGGVRRKAIEYSIAAGKRLYQNLSFPEARPYLQRAYELLRSSNDGRKWEIGLTLAENLIRIGDIKESLAVSKKIRVSARKSKQPEVYLRASFLQFDAMRRLSDYTYLPFCLRLLNKQTELKEICYLVGATYFWQGKLETAERYLKQAVRLSGGDSENLISAYFLLSSIASDRQRFDEAYEKIHGALTLAKETGNLYQEIRILIEWAGILSDANRPEEAKRILVELLPRAEAFGDLYLVAVILLSLGQADIKLTNWEQCREFLEEALRLFSSMGISHGQAKTIMWLGILSFYTEQYPSAYDYYLKATMLFEKTGEMLEASHGYYNLAEVSLKLEHISDAAG